MRVYRCVFCLQPGGTLRVKGEQRYHDSCLRDRQDLMGGKPLSWSEIFWRWVCFWR